MKPRGSKVGASRELFRARSQSKCRDLLCVALLASCVIAFAASAQPFLTDAESLNATQMVVRYSGPVAPFSATNSANYRITNTVSGAQISVVSASLINGTDVLVRTSPRLAFNNYILVVNNVRDSSPFNVIAPNSSIPIATWLALAQMEGEVWHYVDPVWDQFGDVPNQGTAWRQLSFDENNSTNQWYSGTSPFVLNYTSTNTPFDQSTNVTALAQSMHFTAYFRKLFASLASPGGAQLRMRHFINDGAVFYLNDKEIHRFNMPAGQINYDTPAADYLETGSFVDVTLNEPPLVFGSNILAVELHQFMSLDEYAVFAVQVDLRAQSFVTGPVVITGGPVDQTVIEGQPASFTVVQAGGRTFQWQMNNTNYPGATNATLTIPSAQLSQDGFVFHVTVSNSSNAVTSTNATLHVRPDTNAPALLGAYRQVNKTIRLVFSEPLDANSVTNLANYQVTNGFSQTSIVNSAVLSSGTNVLLSFLTLPHTRYAVSVANVRDASTARNLMAPATVWAGFGEIVQSMDGWWRYDDQNIDRGTEWRDVDYSEPSWRFGRALLGAPGNLYVLPEPLRTRVDLDSNGTAHVTYYFRSSFNAFAAPNALLTFRTILDDGCVIYLNGAEIFRLRMPTGAVTFATLANQNVFGPHIDGPFTVPVTNLIDGTNVIAVEVHQSSTSSIDMYWSGKFSLFIPSIFQGPCYPVPFTVPQLRVIRSGTNTFAITWTNPRINGDPCPPEYAIFKLQYTPEWKTMPVEPDPFWDWQHPGPNISEWFDLTTNTPFVLPLTNDHRFYRLKLLP